MAQDLPTRIARQDEELQTRIQKDSIALAKLRWTWVKEKGISGREYARSVVNIHTGKPMHPSAINYSVKAYELWIDPNQEFESFADCVAMAYMGEERQEIAKAVVNATPGISFSGIRRGNDPKSENVREVISDIQAKVVEARAEGREIDIKAEAQKAVDRKVIARVVDRAAAQASAEKKKRDAAPDLVHALELIGMRGKLLKWGKEWDASKISVKNKNFLLATLDELAEAIETVTAAIDGSWDVDWDAELESLVKNNG